MENEDIQKREWEALFPQVQVYPHLAPSVNSTTTMSSRRRSPLLGFVSGSSYSRPSSSKPPRRSTSSRKTASSASSLPPPEAPSPPPAVPPRRRPAPAPAPAPKPAKPDKPDKPDRPAAWPASSEPSTILLALIAFRLLNTLVVRTFFQPDEFFQSLEPAWQAAFGMDQGAWMTWEWRNHLRSSLHPLLFAVFYRVADLLALLLRLSFATRAHLLIAAPKPAQAVVAALGDFYTWKLARRVYGGGSRKTWTVLTLTVVSPWQWFCSTRTLSNCLETTITVVALDLWPWRWSWVSDKPERKPRIRDVDLNRFRLCLCLAGLACVLRPTNIFIWIPLASLILHRCEWDIQKILIREGMICGSAILAVSTLVDRLFYGVWTFPPLKFLYFNVAQSLSVFYGQNDIHYYLSQGFPLLLTTALPFTLTGLYRVITRPLSATSNWQTHMLSQLALICMVMPLALSLISHKEVRFVYPLLPSLHVLSASPLVEFFYPAISRSSRAQTPRRLTLVFLLIINVFVALYTTIYHASGTVNILSYLREQHDRHSPPSTAKHSSPGISVGFLMPCHSTPWRSHMVYPTLNAWALTCEPPVNLNTTQKTTYIDEADQFYDNPAHFLRTNMLGGLRHTPRKPTYLSFPRSSSSRKNQPEQHTWPDYLIFFAQLEPTLSSLLRASSYAECHRTFNTAWHDDWRRKGDVVVWCLDPGEQLAWRSVMREAESARVRREKLLGGVVEGVKRGGEFMKGVVGNGVGRVGSGLRDLGRMDWGRAFDFGGLRWRGTAGQWKIQLPWTSSSKSKSRSKKGNTGSLIDLKKVQPQWRWPSWSSKKDKRGSKKRDLWS